MRLIFLILTLFPGFIGYSQAFGKIKKKKAREITSAFKELDSIVDANKEDTLFYCSPALIHKVERITDIQATEASGSFVGKIYFTLFDYKKWQEWREKKLKQKS